MPQAPSFTDFSWNKIGSQPAFLKRLNDAAPNAGDAGRQYSPSPSPDLEEALIPSGSSPNDDADQFQPQSKRNRLLDALAPEADVDMDDMYVEDDVNTPAGANLGPKEKEAQAQSASLRPQLRKASNGQSNTTNKLFALSQPRSKSGSTTAKISSAPQEKPSAVTKAGSAIGNVAPGSTLTPISPRNHTVPPTPPPENDQLGQPSGQAQATPNHYDSLRAARQRLQSLLDDISKPEVFTPVRDLIQAAKVESHSLAIASQKAVNLSQKALAFAQEALQASQEAAERSRNAKQQWEAALRGCEQRIADQSAKQEQQQEAVQRELAALGESIKLLEAEDRRRTQHAEQEARERQRVQEVPLHGAAATVGPSSLPTPPTAALPLSSASTSGAQTAFATEKQNDPAVSAPMVALIEQMKAQNAEIKHLRNEVTQLQKNVGNSGSSQTTPETQAEPPQHAMANESQPLPKQTMDPKVKEEVLRNKLKSHKKLTQSVPPAAPSRLPSDDLPALTQAQQPSVSPVAQPKLEPIPSTIPEAKVKIEFQEAALTAPYPAVVLPSRKPAPSARQESLQLEYPPMLHTFAETKGVVKSTRPLGSSSTQLSLVSSGGNPTRPTLKPLSAVPPASDTSDDSPIHMDRQGSDPGNLPLFLSEDNSLSDAPTSSTGQSTERRLPLEQAQQLTQEPTLPVIATLSEHSPTESSSSSSFSTPAPVPTQISSPSKKTKGKGRAQARPPLPTAPKPPASAQLPPKPPSTSSQNTTGSISRPRTPSLNSNSMDLAQAISQANRAPAPTPAAPAPSLASPTDQVIRVVRDPLSGAVGTWFTGTTTIIPRLILRTAEIILCLLDEGDRLLEEDLRRRLSFVAE
ncbi:hypothetical protein EST38_g282 [Candolleomyces aberdarensis]|uniref:Uncharacterized protein n=1 Tax=Candolleomyces aberdarensis TaxID=2316362 RepID=A0A4Q2E2F1_9AGAR|nr:hypothetical protein EST38_g282 [Candolleomyces aberdarensis]